jgi:hypothetical protein
VNSSGSLGAGLEGGSADPLLRVQQVAFRCGRGGRQHLPLRRARRQHLAPRGGGGLSLEQFFPVTARKAGAQDLVLQGLATLSLKFGLGLQFAHPNKVRGGL